MITKDNFKEVLTKLDFVNSGDIFTKEFKELDALLKVDFKKQLLIYPEDKGLKINEGQTCNFSDPENFVVFECVNRLLEKGYRAEHIELECYVIESVATSGIGETKLKSYFSEEYGFVRLEYELMNDLKVNMWVVETNTGVEINDLMKLFKTKQSIKQ